MSDAADRYEETADEAHDERVERQLWAEKVPAIYHRVGRTKPLEGYYVADEGKFVSEGGFEYFTDTTPRWSGDKFLVWGTDGLLGEVRLVEEEE